MGLKEKTIGAQQKRTILKKQENTLFKPLAERGTQTKSNTEKSYKHRIALIFEYFIFLFILVQTIILP